MAGSSPRTCSLSSELLHVLQHSLGVDKYGQGNQYRNHYVTSPECKDGKLCQELVGHGFMKDHGPQSLASGMHCYSVTPNGIDAVAFKSPNPPKLTRSKKRYAEFLRSDCGLTFAEWIGASKRTIEVWQPARARLTGARNLPNDPNRERS